MPVELKRVEQKSFDQRRLVSLFAIISIFLFFIVLIPRFVFAADIDINSALNDLIDLDEVADKFASVNNALLKGVYIKDTLNVFYGGTVTETIIGNLDSQAFVTGAKAAIRAIAMLLIVYHMLVTLMKELERGEMTTESWLRILIAFVIPCVMIIEYDKMINVFSKTGTWMQEIMNNNTTFSIDVVNEKTGIEPPGSPGLGQLGAYVHDLFNYLKGYIMGILLFIGYGLVTINIILTIMSGVMSNFIEIVLRHLFMPFAFANISHEGVRSAGVRYIKKYLGCYIKIGSIMLAVSAIFYVYDTLCGISSIQDWHKVVFFILILPVSKQTLKMCSEIISDALGD